MPYIGKDSDVPMNTMRSLAAKGLGKPATPLCPECGNRFRRALVPFRMYGHLFGYFPADVCRKGHDYFPEESTAAIEAEAKALGLWGRDARPKRLGSSPRGKPPPAIRRPSQSLTRTSAAKRERREAS